MMGAPQVSIVREVRRVVSGGGGGCVADREGKGREPGQVSGAGAHVLKVRQLTVVFALKQTGSAQEVECRSSV